MANLLTDTEYAVVGRLVAIDNSGLVGPMFILRTPPKTFDVQRPASYMDFILLDVKRKTLQKRIDVDDELSVILHAAAASISKGTRNEMTFQTELRSKSRRISHCHRIFDSCSPINGKVIENDGRHTIVVDAGVPIIISLPQLKPTQTREIKINSWMTVWPSPPTHGIILGKA